MKQNIRGSSAASMSRANKTVICPLLCIELLAIHSMWIQIHRNGHYARMVHLRDNGPHLLPGSTIPLKKQYVGIEAIDYVLTVLQVTFANFVDGSAPGLSIFAFQFSGTLLTAIILIWVGNIMSSRPDWL